MRESSMLTFCNARGKTGGAECTQTKCQSSCKRSAQAFLRVRPSDIIWSSFGRRQEVVGNGTALN